MARRFRRGISIDTDTLAYDVIVGVGSQGNFLMEADTLERCRTEFWQPSFIDRGGLEAWMAGGQEDAVSRARRRWQYLLERHTDPPLDATTIRQLQAFAETHRSADSG
jgi:trimethylamine--corrinoid protein Co-methyltransferase